MIVSCEIIRDLLPLYYDDVCSMDSRTLIENHLTGCESCKEKLEKIGEELNYTVPTNNDVNAIKKISAMWNKGKFKAFVKGIVITASIGIVLFISFLGLTQCKIIPVDSQLIKISDVCQLSDGKIAYHVEILDDRNLHFVRFTTYEDGSYYQTPYRSIIESKRIMDRGLYNDYYLLDVEENNAYQKSFGNGIEITSCYFGSKEDGILIWEKGMELPPASDKVEAIFLPE